MNQAQIDRKFHLDGEIRELLQFAFEEFGEEGLSYVKSETSRIVDGLFSDELKNKQD